MTNPPVCPRCLGALDPPDLWTSTWRCERHGDVAPFHAAASGRAGALAVLRDRSGVPVWAPDPLPVDWFASGVAWAGDERVAPVAAATAATGPSPLGGPADLVLVAEEPGVGLGARLAGLPGADPGELDGPAVGLLGSGLGAAASEPPEGWVEAAGHPTPMWPVRGADDRAAFVGEASGVWLWLVLWPADAALLLLEGLVLRDLRDALTTETPVVFGAPSPYLGPG